MVARQRPENRRPAPAVRSAQQGSGARRFEYHRRTEEDAQRQIDRSRSRFDNPFKRSFIPFKARGGDNTVRILPPTWPNPNHYAFKVHMHRYVGAENGTYLCLKKMKGMRCPCCEAERDEREQGDPEVAKKLAEREMWLSWILDREARDPEKPLIWQMSSMQDEEIIKLTRDRRSGATIFPEDPSEGYDLNFTRKQLNADIISTRYSSFKFDMSPSPILDDPDAQQAVLDYIAEHPIPDILQFHEVGHLEEMMSGTAEAADEELDSGEEDVGDSEDDRSSRSRGGPRREAPAEDEEELQDDEGTGEEGDEEEGGEEEGGEEAAAEDESENEAAEAAADAEEIEEETEAEDPPLRRRAASNGGNGSKGRERTQQPRRAASPPARPTRTRTPTPTRTPARPAQTRRGGTTPSRGRYRD